MRTCILCCVESRKPTTINAENEVNELLSDVRFWFTAMGLGLLALVKILWTKHESRLDLLEADAVRRKEFDQLRADFQAKHEENGTKLDQGFTRIEALIERNNQSAIDGRHDVKNQILGLVEKVGTIQGRMGLDEFKERG